MRPPKTKEEKKLRAERWRKNNPDKIKSYTMSCNTNLKLEVISHYSNGNPKCLLCGIDDIDVLCLDHINGGGEAHRRTIARGNGIGHHLYWWVKKNNYPDGFQILCLNCNWKKHLMKVRQVSPDNRPYSGIGGLT